MCILRHDQRSPDHGRRDLRNLVLCLEHQITPFPGLVNIHRLILPLLALALALHTRLLRHRSLTDVLRRAFANLKDTQDTAVQARDQGSPRAVDDEARAEFRGELCRCEGEAVGQDESPSGEGRVGGVGPAVEKDSGERVVCEDGYVRDLRSGVSKGARGELAKLSRLC